MTDAHAGDDAGGQAEVSGAAPPEDLERRLNDLDKRLTQRLNTINKTFTDAVSELATKVGTAVNTVRQLSTKVDNNEASIKGFQGSLDTLTTDVGRAKSAVAVAEQHLAQVEEWQGAINTAWAEGIQQAKDFALEQGNAAKTHATRLDQRRGEQTGRALEELSGALKRVEDAPVKPHTHAVHVSVETENPSIDGGNG